MDILQNNKHGTFLQSLLSIDFWSKNLLLLYIFTMPFVSAFAFSGTISLPLIFAVVLFMIMGVEIVLSGKFPRGFIGFDVVILFIFLFFVLLSFGINGLGNTLSLNHTIAYISTFSLFYVTIKFTFFCIKDKDLLFKRVIQFITYTTIISAIYANAEFISSNFFDVDLNDYVLRPSAAEESYKPTVLAFFYRARGFATESGHFTFMMELFSPLAVYFMYFSGFCKWHPSIKALLSVIIVFCFLFAVSSASFVIIPLAVFLASLIHMKRIFFYIKRQTFKFFAVSGIVAVIIILFNYFFSFYALILLSISDKLDSNSFEDRQQRVNFFYDKFSHFDLIKKIIGVSPAGFDIMGFDESKAILSLYYSITFEIGLLGLFLILLLFIYFFFHALNIKKTIGFFLLISIISGIFHYYFIANFWYPWFWFIAAFTILCSKHSYYSEFRA